MTLLQGPLGSADARGTLAGLLTFSNRRGRHVAGITTAPKQPRTEAQMATRIWLAWLSKQWNTISPADQATWLNSPDTAVLSPYHAYMKYNVNRFKNLPGHQYWVKPHPNYPTAAYPATQATLPSDFPSPGIVNRQREYDINFTITTINDNWLFMCHRLTTEHPFAVYANLVGIWTVTTAGPQTLTVTNATPGTYIVHIINASRTGGPRDHYRGKTVNPKD